MFLGSQDNENPYNYKLHFLQFLENEEDLDLLFLKFEEIENDPKRALQQIMDHLEYNLVLSQKEIDKVLNVRSIRDEENTGDYYYYYI